MQTKTLSLLLLTPLACPEALARGDGTFRSPFVLPNAGRPGPATVHSGDLNGDGKLDLLAANGGPRVLVYLQGLSSREQWRQIPLPVGSQTWFVRSADFTGDGRDDIVASDISATAFFVKSLPDDGFQSPVPIPESKGARWIAIGDWNNDAKLDFATANISAADITVFLGDGGGGFALSQRLAGSREHTLEALDYDADGKLDLFLGTGLTGITPHQGLGDGTFAVKPSFEHLGCVEYLAEVGHYEAGSYVLHGDLNGDGKGDLAPTCVETTSASAGISRGDGTYEETLETLAGPDVDSSALADLSGDGNTDLALVSKGSTSLHVHLGKGDGYFQPEPAVFGPTGDTPVFLIVRDLDRDGFLDLVSADQLSSTLTVFWGRDGERFLESASSVTGFAAAKSMGAADLDSDGAPDLFLPRSDRPEVQVYLGPGKAPASKPSLVIPIHEKATLLEAADLDGDGVPDLAGADPISGKAVVALLDRAGSTRGPLSLEAGLSPSSVEVGRLDPDAVPDLAVPCKGANHVAVFLGKGGGAFAEAKVVPTLEKPKGAALGDWDGDGLADLAVISDTVAAVHFGKGGGEFEQAVEVARDAAKLFTDCAAGDLNGDSRQDLLISESKALSVLYLESMEGRKLAAPAPFKTSGAPTALVPADLDGDGRLDVTTSSTSARSASVLLQGEGLELKSSSYGLGLPPASHRVLDMDSDGALDLAAFSATTAVILSGRLAGAAEPRFRRGDVSGEGRLAINDPILILARLFQGGAPLACDDAADADDSGVVNLSDPIAVLRHLFMGAGPLPPPGPDECGEDGGQDALGCDSGCP
ncbi:MAG: VCBS repeat-containing protein [Planctomycetes bacterium]|nr:VCBS repeat-containing protein [Planctomycetota bacterium]